MLRLKFGAGARTSLFLGLVLCGQMAASAGFPLKGATVVVPDAFVKSPVSGWGLAAARDLTNALCRVTGVQSALVAESAFAASGVPVIFVGPTKAAERAGIDVSKLRKADARLRVEPGRAFIAAPGELGASNGVVEFLLRFADYWFVTIDGADPFVFSPDVMAPESDEVFSARFYWRHVSLTGQHWKRTSGRFLQRDYSRRLCVPSWEVACAELEPSAIPRVSRYGHSFYKYLPPDKYFKDHPEYYSLGADGTRHAKPNDDSQLCLSNPEVLEQVTTNLFAFIDEDRKGKVAPYPVIYDFAQMDCSPYLCKCPNCQKIVARYNRVPGGNFEGGDMGLLLTFVNELARRAKAKYGDIVIRTFAYVSTEEAPVGIEPEPNVMVWWCDLYSSSCHDLPLGHPFNRQHRDIELDWSKRVRHLEVWDYWLYTGGYPEVFVDAVAADMRFHDACGVERMFVESFFDYQPFYELNTFVTARCLVRPSEDVEKLVSKYCRVYGAAAKEMKTAVDFLRHETLTRPPRDAASWHARALPWRNRETWSKFRALLERALAKADTVPGRSRIAAVLAKTCRELCQQTRGRPGLGTEYARAKKDYGDYTAISLEGSPLDGKDVARARKICEDELVTMDVAFKDIPEELKGVPEKDLISLEHHSMYVGRPSGVLVDDPASECGKAYRRFRQEENNAAPFKCILKDVDKDTRDFFVINPPADGKYHWHRLGVARVGRSSRLFITYDKYISFGLGNRYIECDGLAEDLNWYEFWASVRYNGPATESPDTGLFVDRMMLRRQPRPTGATKSDLRRE